MKKIIAVLFASFLAYNVVLAEDVTLKVEALPTETAPVEAQSGMKDEAQPTSHLQEKEKTSYILYHGDGCPHCHEIDLYFKKNKIYENFNIIKKEVWKNKKNAEEMMKKTKELGIPRPGVPFLLINDGEKEVGLSGSDKIESYFSPLLSDEITSQNNDGVKKSDEITSQNNDGAKNSDNKKMIMLIVLALLAVVVPVAFIKLSK